MNILHLSNTYIRQKAVSDYFENKLIGPIAFRGEKAYMLRLRVKGKMNWQLIGNG